MDPAEEALFDRVCSDFDAIRSEDYLMLILLPLVLWTAGSGIWKPSQGVGLIVVPACSEYNLEVEFRQDIQVPHALH